ncbi:MAG TPA: hypothetical protein VIJ06_07215 [Methylovirgula sp.]
MLQSPPAAKARQTLDGVRVARLPPPGSGDVAYVVLTPAPVPAAAPIEGRDKRAERRWGTHLRSGKILDGRTCIVTESLTANRSARGARLRLATPVLLPKRIRFFDDVTKRLFEAAVAWQRGREIGVTFLREIEPNSLTRTELFRLGIKVGRAAH